MTCPLGFGAVPLPLATAESMPGGFTVVDPAGAVGATDPSQALPASGPARTTGPPGRPAGPGDAARPRPRFLGRHFG